MKKYIKPALILICLQAFLTSIQAQEKYDLFPLHSGMHYSYSYYEREEWYFVDPDPHYVFIDSGKVEYLVIDSLNLENTLIIWNIEQVQNLLHRIEGGLTDSTVDSSYFQLYEYLIDDHELKCSSLIWNLPFLIWDFPSNHDSSFYRYSNHSENLTLLAHNACLTGIDSIWFSNKAGMYRFVRNSIWDCSINTVKTYLYVSQIDIPDNVKMIRPNNIDKFVLSPNYPNPFNPTTKIEYNLPKMSLVEIKIYDVLGNEITSLVNEEKPAGEYEVEFDGTGLPSGVYFYQLRAGNFVETKKMILMK